MRRHRTSLHPGTLVAFRGSPRRHPQRAASRPRSRWRVRRVGSGHRWAQARSGPVLGRCRTKRSVPLPQSASPFPLGPRRTQTCRNRGLPRLGPPTIPSSRRRVRPQCDGTCNPFPLPRARHSARIGRLVQLPSPRRRHGGRVRNVQEAAQHSLSTPQQRRIEQRLEGFSCLGNLFPPMFSLLHNSAIARQVIGRSSAVNQHKRRRQRRRRWRPIETKTAGEKAGCHSTSQPPQTPLCLLPLAPEAQFRNSRSTPFRFPFPAPLRSSSSFQSP